MVINNGKLSFLCHFKDLVDISGRVWGFLNFWSINGIMGCFRKRRVGMFEYLQQNAFINQ